MTVFEAYITNLGKYAEGQLVGETLKFPAITEEVQSLLKNIGVDGVLYEEFFITAFDGDVMGLGITSPVPGWPPRCQWGCQTMPECRPRLLRYIPAPPFRSHCRSRQTPPGDH